MTAKTARFLLILTALFFLGAAVSAVPVMADDFLNLRELYQNNTFLLWNEHASLGGEPVGAAFYWKVRSRDSRGGIERSFHLSAGHIMNGRLVRGPNSDITYRIPKVLFRINKSDLAPDFLVGTLTEYRANPTYFKKLSRDLKAGEHVFTASTNPEWGKKIELQRLRLIEDHGNILSFQAEFSSRDGMSGLPVVTREGELVGIYVGDSEDNPFVVYVMPMREVIKIYKYIGGDMEELNPQNPNMHRH